MSDILFLNNTKRKGSQKLKKQEPAYPVVAVKTHTQTEKAFQEVLQSLEDICFLQSVITPQVTKRI